MRCAERARSYGPDPAWAVSQEVQRRERGGGGGHVLPACSLSEAAEAVSRRTRQRSAIVALLGEADIFRSAQDLHELLRGEAVGLATVYRVLHTLAAAGEADVVRMARGELPYGRCGPGHHHHLICRSCGRATQIASPARRCPTGSTRTGNWRTPRRNRGAGPAYPRPGPRPRDRAARPPGHPGIARTPGSLPTVSRCRRYMPGFSCDRAAAGVTTGRPALAARSKSSSIATTARSAASRKEAATDAR
jgi:Fur family ferric uptake transcriptional regulator